MKINTHSFRSDIAGLRAFSVIIIIIYHFFPSYLPSGFIGVDIFFVISGFLISQILLFDQYKHSFFSFLKSRFLRLAPALLSVLLVSLILGWFFLLQDEYLALSKSGFSSLIAQSNLYEMLRSGYFENTISSRPLLHLWSLAVEIHFYLFISVFIFWQRNNKKIIWLLLFLMSCSFIANILFIDINSTANFYLSPFRLWEFLLGSIVFIYQRDKKIPSYFSYIGIFLLIISLFVIDTHSPFPGWVAVLPVLASGFILLNNQSNNVSHILSLKPMVFIGTISYALYLWHWPLLDFSKLTFGSLSPLFRIFLGLFTFILACVTTFYIEKPIRANKKFLFMIFSFCITLVITLFIYSQLGFPNRHVNTKNQILQTKENLIMDYRNECASILGVANKEDRCQFLHYNNGVTSLAIIGDSQANAFSTVLDRINALGYLQFGRGMCPALLKYGDSDCQDFAERAFNFISNERYLNKIIIAAQWPLYLKSLKIAGKNITQDDFWMSLEKTISAYKKLNKEIYILYAVPLGAEPRKCFQRLPFMNSDCDLSKDVFLSNQAGYIARMDELVSKYHLKKIDITELLCDKYVCKVKNKNKLLYLDGSHLSRAGGNYVADKLNPQLKVELSGR
ncbi:acyltransferase family protein [Candidatus Methylopumilus universalis]|uniref:acyltransferase family protein n=1 Tax=Candidatus Methylopumilus universalis TaxID=2588536 RepID=UPI001678457C|nr:acyltransferase family protein [Candidatus Methylopumilus universalis]